MLKQQKIPWVTKKKEDKDDEKLSNSKTIIFRKLSVFLLLSRVQTSVTQTSEVHQKVQYGIFRRYIAGKVYAFFFHLKE